MGPGTGAELGAETGDNRLDSKPEEGRYIDPKTLIGPGLGLKLPL
jgi:hypothetical protein